MYLCRDLACQAMYSAADLRPGDVLGLFSLKTLTFEHNVSIRGAVRSSDPALLAAVRALPSVLAKVEHRMPRPSVRPLGKASRLFSGGCTPFRLLISLSDVFLWHYMEAAL